MSFSRKYGSHQQTNAANHYHRGGTDSVLDGSRKRYWYSSNAYHSSGATESGVIPPLKRRRNFSSASNWQLGGSQYCPSNVFLRAVCGFGNEDGPSTSNNLSFYPKTMIGRANHIAKPYAPTISNNSERVRLAEDEDPIFMSRDQIERCSPSRKDGIDTYRETQLRHSYCAFLQSLGMRLELPQTTIGTAMVLCHRFFVRRSHACHDRFLIATAALFLAAKSEETPRPLNSVIKESTEICHKQDVSLFPYLFPSDWLENYRECVTEAEQLLLTTLNFELNVQHPYTPLITVLEKLGLTESVLLNLAWNLISKGITSNLLICGILTRRIDGCSCKHNFTIEVDVIQTFSKTCYWT